MMDRRAKYANGLSTLYLPYYQALCGVLDFSWQPYYGIRTVAEQDLLFSKGRTSPGLIVTNAPGGASAHNYGCGTDWTVFDENGVPQWPDKESSLWQTYRDACHKVGLTWGGEWKGLTDYYHNELTLDLSWSEVKKILDSQGMAIAMDFIATHAVK